MGPGRRGTRTRVVASWSAALVLAAAAGGVLMPVSAVADPLFTESPGSVVTKQTDPTPTESGSTPTSIATPTSPAPDGPTGTPPGPTASTSVGASGTPSSGGSTVPVPPPPTPSAPTPSDPPTVTVTAPTELPLPSSTRPAPSPSTPPTPGEPAPTLQAPVTWSVSALGIPSGAAVATVEAATLPVTVRTTCRAVVFANPDPREAAVVAWGDFSRRAPDKSVTIPAGGAVRIAVTRSALDWAAGRTKVDVGRLGATGRGDRVSVDQDCVPSARSLTAVVSTPCLSRRQPVTVLTTGAAAAADLSWWVNRRGSPLTVTDGLLSPGRPTPVDLSRFGPGRYELTVADGTTVLDRTDFALQDCVVTTVDCAAVTWANPAGNSAVTVAFRDGSTVPRAVELAAGQSARVLTSGAVRWAATATLGQGSRLSDAGAEAKVGVDDSCAAGGATRSAAVAADDGSGSGTTAATGPADGSPGPTAGVGPGWVVVGALLAAVAAVGVGLGARALGRRTRARRT